MSKNKKITISMLTVIIFLSVIVISNKIMKSNDSNTTSINEPINLISSYSNPTSSSSNYAEPKILESSNDTLPVNESIKSTSTSAAIELPNTTLTNSDQLPKDTNYTSYENSHPASTNVSISTPYEEEYLMYIVKPKDTLYKISKNYSTTCPIGACVKTLLAINNLTESDGLKEGMTLFIPDKYFKSGKKYIAQPKDTFYTLARKFIKNGSTDQGANYLINKNYMKDDNLRKGIEVFIPLNE